MSHLGLDLELLCVEFEFLRIQFEPLSGEVAVTQADDVVEYRTPKAQLLATLRPVVAVIHRRRVMYGDEREHGVGQFFRAGGLAQFFGVGEPILEATAAFLLGYPVAVTAAFPFGDILRSDAGASELPGKDFLGLRQAVEPLDQA